MTQSTFALLDSDIAPVTEGAIAGAERANLGILSEKAFDLEASKRGWLVAVHGGSGRDFDFILKRPSFLRPVSVQVKRTKLKRGGRGNSVFYSIKCTNTAGHHYEATAYDVLAVHLADVDKWVFYRRSELGNRKGTSYLPPEMRQNAVSKSAPDARDPNNWHLLDEVAASPGVQFQQL